MTKVKLLSLAVVGLFLLNIAILTHFLIMAPNFGGRPESPKMFILDNLGFDDKQEAKFDELIAVHQVAVAEKDKAIIRLKQELFEELKNPESKRAEDITSKIGELQKGIEMIHFAHFEDIRNLCSSDQLPKFNQMVENIAGIFDNKSGNRPPPRK